MRLSALGLALALSIACVHSTPVANVASPATQVEQTGVLILQAAQQAHVVTNPLTQAPLLSTAQLDAVALACDKLGRLGTALAQALTDYAAAKAAVTDTTALAAAIRGLVMDASTALGEIGVAVPQGTVATIDALVATALNLYLQIAAGAL